MKSAWFPITLVVLLLGLLGLLATLQYRWLGQISDGERERLAGRLEADTLRFADDFNREIQSAYFNFQLNESVWREKDWDEFNRRLEFWRSKAAHPNLIKDFYFVELNNTEKALRYNRQTRGFDQIDWTENLKNLKANITSEKNFLPIAEEIPALLMPVHEADDEFNRIITVRTAKPEQRTAGTAPPMAAPKKYGVLVIELDADAIKNQVLPDLAKKYFSDSRSADYKIAVVNRDSQTVFQTEQLTAADASATFFNLAAENFLFYANRDLISTAGERKSFVFNRVETRAPEAPQTRKESRLEVKVAKEAGEEKPRVRIFESGNMQAEGVWTLNVQHAAGSLEQFIANTRNKNLAVSFGILSLLGVSVVLIFLSAQRAKRFAQSQIDFVSAVSHEFRTPLAVICSAGENLTDGVVSGERQVERYGDLIKGEGKKLAAMVEQILEFAGARSGKRKYDFRPANVEEIVETALSECESLIEEKNFTVEKSIAANLPDVLADKTALSRALENLIANSIKYGGENCWLKISAANGAGKIKITVEDKGIGISPKDLKHIFEPFYRSRQAVDEQIRGNGLGLNLVKQTVEAHGGNVTVESQTGRGSRFTISIPLSYEKQNSADRR